MATHGAARQLSGLRLIPFGEVAVAVDAIDPRQDFRHAGEHLRRHFVADFPMLEQHPRERLVFDDRHLMLRGEFADTLRVEADALGHDFRSFHGFAVIAQGHGDYETRCATAFAIGKSGSCWTDSG